jgi:hypothetical protein
MSVLTHTPNVFREDRAQAAYASHIAMIKRFAAFVLTLGGFAVAVAAVISFKLAIYLPHLPH